MSNVGYTFRPVKYKHSNPNRSVIDAFDYTVGAKVDNIIDLYDIPPEKINLGGLVYVVENDEFYKLIDKSKIDSSDGWEKHKFSNLSVSFTTITSGGNYHDTELTGNVIVLTNTNAQAIFTGFDSSKYKRITIIDKGNFETLINSEDTNSLPKNRVNMPISISSTGVGGSTELVYIESINRWQVVSSYASKDRPEHRGLTETQVETVTSEAKSETVPIIELIVFRDAQSTEMSKAGLNTAYPNASRGFQVVCKQIDTIYIKVDDNRNDWQPINTRGNVL